MEVIYVILIIAFIGWLFGHSGSWGALVKSYKYNVWSRRLEGDRTYVPFLPWPKVLAFDEYGETIYTGVSYTIVSTTGLHFIQSLLIQPFVPSIYVKWSDISGYCIEGNSVRLNLVNSRSVGIVIPTKYLPGFEKKYNKNRHATQKNARLL